MNRWREILFGILIGLLASAAILLTASPPKGKSIQLLPIPSPMPLVVHVLGGVKNPGVYSLPQESRVKDAIQAAGGLSENADQSAVNLAARIRDGQRISIPFISDHQTGQVNDSVLDTRQQMQSEALLNINTATVEDLDKLPGIGAEKAKSIIEFREKNGPFKSIEDLLNVPGIGQSILEKIKDRVTIEDPP